jgi:signal transduction histidine kinase
MSIFHELNIKKQCDNLKVNLWECPHFLFVIMGTIIVVSMIGTNLIAQNYAQPELAALVVIIVTSVIFVISHIVIRSFERIAESSRARTEFISIVSHQLRNPLSSIQWQIEVLLRDKSISQKTYSYLEGINEYNNRMKKLVNDLLTVNRIESDRLTLVPVPFSVEELTQKIVKDNTIYARASNISLAVKSNKNLPLVYADENHIRWAIENLINNAIRYSNPHSNINITIDKKSSFVRLQITNHGAQITLKDSQHIFKKFFRAASSARNRTDGSGLGLFISKSVIEASGGTIDFTSEPTGETTFWFTLPRAKKQKSKKESLVTNT